MSSPGLPPSVGALSDDEPTAEVKQERDRKTGNILQHCHKLQQDDVGNYEAVRTFKTREQQSAAVEEPLDEDELPSDASSMDDDEMMAIQHSHSGAGSNPLELVPRTQRILGKALIAIVCASVIAISPLPKTSGGSRSSSRT